VFRHCEGNDSIETVKIYISSHSTKKTQRLREGKDRHCVLFMSDVSALHKSCVAHLAKWTTLFAEFKCFE